MPKMNPKCQIPMTRCVINVLLLIFISQIPSVVFADIWALLVGIDDYEHPDISDLNYTVNDVKRFYEALVHPQVGGVPESQVYLMTNRSTGENRPTHSNVLFRLETLASRIHPNDTFLFYFSGHGMRREGEQYLLSINADPRSLTTLERTAITRQQLQKSLNLIPAHQIVVFLDACRNNPEKAKGDEDNLLTEPLARAVRITPRVEENELLRGTATFYACSVGERAYEWHEQKSGVFSWYLVDGLRGKGANTHGQITLRSLADYVTKKVVAWSREQLASDKHQKPWLVSEGAADMVLIPRLALSNEPPSDTPKEKESHLAPYQEAIETYKQALRINPADANASYGLGVASAKLGRSDEAIEAFKQVIRINPKSAEAHYSLGWVYHDLGLYEKAIEAYKQAIEINPSSPQTYHNLGVVYRNLGRYNEAAEAYKQAIQIAPENAEVYNGLGWVSHKLGRYNEAIAAYKQAIRINPKHGNASHNLGQVYHNLGRYDEAIAAYKQAIHINPENASAFYNLGLAYRQLNQHKEAIEAYKQVIRINPEDARAHYHLGLSCVDAEDINSALVAYKALKPLDPELANKLFHYIYK